MKTDEFWGNIFFHVYNLELLILSPKLIVVVIPICRLCTVFCHSFLSK
jgi:hypothetical protein